MMGGADWWAVGAEGGGSRRGRREWGHDSTMVYTKYLIVVEIGICFHVLLDKCPYAATVSIYYTYMFRHGVYIYTYHRCIYITHICFAMVSIYIHTYSSRLLRDLAEARSTAEQLERD